MNEEISILITGDFCPGGRLSKIETFDPNAVLGDFLPFISNSDLAISNLECPLTEAKSKITKTGPALKSTIAAAYFLKRSGFNLLTLANNHIMDYGNKGLEDTLKALNDVGIPFVGAGLDSFEAAKVYIVEKHNLKVAILNFAENEWSTTHGAEAGANPIDPVKNFKQILEAKKVADRVIVITHGGHEMYRLPSPRMKQLYRFYVEAGADAVVNHHTHCTSGYEIYQGAPIFYSLGNFLFDHPVHRHDIWNEGMAVKLILSKDRIFVDLVFFDQCNELAALKVCSNEIAAERTKVLGELSNIIASDSDLSDAFELWVQRHKKLYTGYIEPHHNRYIQSLQNRGWIPSLWNKRKKQYLLNLIRCESHRDVLQRILESEDSNP